MTDDDCKLQNDCCGCAGLPVGDDIPACPITCIIDQCTPLEITEAACVAGTCTVKRLSCEEEPPFCTGVPPFCSAGEVPETANHCYTQECVPELGCDVVSDCSMCLDHEICVEEVTTNGATRCLPVPADCDGTADCACAGDDYCTGELTSCNETSDGIACSCPTC